jgi:deazaflavin-dependent oxidoreductase (nitroreductase family)
MLLLAHLGARSGQRRISGLTYMPYDGSFVVVGSNGGGPRGPGWVYNLRAHPDVEVQVGPEKIAVRAREAGEDERQRLWPEAVRYHPAWGLFQQRTRRAFALVILTPRGPALSSTV